MQVGMVVFGPNKHAIRHNAFLTPTKANRVYPRRLCSDDMIPTITLTNMYWANVA
jgi:hypothetical protein